MTSGRNWRAGLARAGIAWRDGAAAICGPLVVVGVLLGTLFGVAGVVQVFVGRGPWDGEALVWAAALTAVLGPWFVAHGWLKREHES